jgi:DNA (cytosine-5)-methyltransferase 1
MDIGFAKAGFQTELVAELDAAACQTLEANRELIGHIGEEEIIPTNVCDLNLGHFEAEGIDAVFGGPPCQGFSVAGKMDPNDERSDLVFDFMRTVCEVRPKSFVMENVKALALSPRWEAVRNRFKRRASMAGYQTSLILLKATDYGVPQARERMFFIGIRKDLVKPGSMNLREGMLAQLESHRKPHKTLREVIQEFGPAGSQGNPKTCTAKISYAKSPILRKSPYAGMLFNGAGRPISVEGASPTLPASMGGNKTPIVDEGQIFGDQESFIEEYHKHLINGRAPNTGTAPERLRRLTIRECAAIQTFPADYDFRGSKSSIYKQIGNAVPCHLAEVVAKSLSAILDECILPSGKIAAE